MYNILVCDDEKDIRRALNIYLSGEGYAVCEVASGAEAAAVTAGAGVVFGTGAAVAAGTGAVFADWPPVSSV